MNKTKRKFFDNLHEKLGNKYKIHSHAVQIIRSITLGDKKSSSQILAKMNELISRKKAKALIYQNVIGFIKNCKPEEWKDLIQKTKFDKE